MTATALVVMVALAWRRGRSPLEIVSLRAAAAFIAAIRRRVPHH